SADHSASQDIVITITGTNDAASISGTASGAVVEAGGVNNGIAGTPTASGTLTDVDVDDPNNTFTKVMIPIPSANGYGTFTMTAGGVWTYQLNNNNATVQALNIGQSLTDRFTVATVDGTARIITVTINGANDAAVISGTTTGTVVEAGSGTPGTPNASGRLTDADIDNLANSFTAVSTATASTCGYGTFTMSAEGLWTYTLNNSNPTIQALKAGETLIDTFSVTTVDGTAQVITVTINGTNDGLTIASGRTFKINGDTLEEPSIYVEGTLQGFGKVTGDDGALANIVDNGLIAASSSHALLLNANISGTGVLELSNNTTMELGGSVAASLSVVFAIGAGSTGKLILDDPAEFQASISGFAGTDVIDLRGFAYSSTTKTVLSSSNPNATIGAEKISLVIGSTETMITISEGLTSAAIKLEGNYSGHSFTFSSDGMGGTQFIDPLVIDSGTTLVLPDSSFDSILFANNNGISGMLVLSKPTSYTGTIFGFTGTDPQTSDLIDLQGIVFDAGTSWTYFDSLGADSGGVLTIYETVNGVTKVVDSITFGDGDFTTANFILEDDGHGGTMVIDPPFPHAGAAAHSLPNLTTDAPTLPSINSGGQGTDAHLPGNGGKLTIASSDMHAVDGSLSTVTKFSLEEHTSSPWLTNTFAKDTVPLPSAVVAIGGHDQVSASSLLDLSLVGSLPLSANKAVKNGAGDSAGGVVPGQVVTSNSLPNNEVLEVSEHHHSAWIGGELLIFESPGHPITVVGLDSTHFAPPWHP
ncbi:VCBS domain-containing protein, partial [Bradyrhizobium sp. MOS002]|uniref:VCBS domain-containing protein n=1 Tax=Bradyrhizobium sp. MOS002 TaxID=2133947 RepID=UPI000D40C0F7